MTEQQKLTFIELLYSIVKVYKKHTTLNIDVKTENKAINILINEEIAISFAYFNSLTLNMTKLTSFLLDN